MLIRSRSPFPVMPRRLRRTSLLPQSPPRAPTEPIKPDRLSPTALGIDPVTTVKKLAHKDGGVREVPISLAHVNFGEPAINTSRPNAARLIDRDRLGNLLDHRRVFKCAQRGAATSSLRAAAQVLPLPPCGPAPPLRLCDPACASGVFWLVDTPPCSREPPFTSA
jgi:hypothetical protein